MRFWDASALVPLFATEAETANMATILGEDSDVVVWWACRSEVKSALYRKVRERTLASADAERAVAKVDALIGNQAVDVPPTDEIRNEADVILSRHSLRAADAFHLAAWKLCAGHLPFVCLDKKLREAAVAEGASVIP